MKRAIITVIALSSMASLTRAATVTWDGEVDQDLTVVTNWINDAAISETNDYVVSTNTGFLFSGGWCQTIAGNFSSDTFGSLTISAAGTDANDGRYQLRTQNNKGGYGRLFLNGDLTFTGSDITGPLEILGVDVGMGIAFKQDASIINNTSATAEFGNDFNGAVAISGWQGSDPIVRFGGSGDFLLGPNMAWDETAGANPSWVERIWTAGDFGGTLTITNGTEALFVDIDLRAQGGTIKIEGADTIDDTVALSLADAGSGTEINIAGLTDTMFDLNSFGGGDLRVDESTAVVFEDFRSSSGTIDILDWSEGSSSMVFTNLGRQFYSGTIAQDEPFGGLTIGGSTAYMTAYDDGTITGWAVSDGLTGPVTTTIESTEAVGETLKLIINTDGALADLKPVGRTDLTLGSWGYIPHSSSSTGTFLTTNLTYSVAEGTNVAIYVQATNSAAFFGVE